MKKKLYIGFDTSNYTTSLAVSDDDGNILTNLKCPLAVREGERGLRQSEAVFAHVKNFPEIAAKLRSFISSLPYEAELAAGACSYTPRDIEGSYMPCFLVGVAVAETVCSVLDIPLYRTSHQAGHIIAAAAAVAKDYGFHLNELISREHIALHVSGGTTDLLYVRADSEKLVSIERIGGSADANAGQIIDRTGVRLGFSFPCGPELDTSALSYTEKIKGIVPSVKGLECNLSGLENKASDMIAKGKDTAEVSAFVLEFIARTVEKIVLNAFETYGKLPVVFAGGVMSSKYIKNRLSKLGMFSHPQFSADNAAGVAIIASIFDKRTKEGG